jgi:DNA-binding NarL/FixJ family response regulator
MDTVRVLLVGEDPLARSGIAALLAGHEGVAVVGQVAPGDDVAASLNEEDAEAVLWDLGIERRSPAEVATERLPPLDTVGRPVLALLDGDESAADALAAGARGLVFRDAGPERLVAALRAAAQGLLVLDPSLADSVLRVSTASAPALAEPLTPRELEVLQLLSQGLANKAIAARLGISDHTAKFHVNSILGKLGVQSRTEAIVHAARLGLVAL